MKVETINISKQMIKFFFNEIVAKEKRNSRSLMFKVPIRRTIDRALLLFYN